MGKWVFVFFMLIVAYVGYEQFIKSTPPTPRQQAAQPAPTPQPATTWERDYETNFNYGKQLVRVSSVKVQNLDRTTASVTYTIAVTPTGNTKWITRKPTWQVGRASDRQSARRITKRMVDRTVVVFPRFRVATDQLERGSYLQIIIPEYNRRGKLRRTWPVRLGLEIPLSHRGIEERNGQGGF